jgi:hypothetical protein
MATFAFPAIRGVDLVPVGRSATLWFAKLQIGGSEQLREDRQLNGRV